MQDTLLYESVKIWDQSLQLGQKNLAQAICDFFPAGVETALDVGCGDGKLTSTIIAETQCAITGLDASKEALSRCAFKTIHGDATNLPFEEQSFDLVLTTDMLEHLPKPMEDKVWQQLFRISKAWVMVAVPFREELLDATAKCRYCDQLYHVNWHMRSYDWPELTARCPDNYEIDKIILTGEAWTTCPILETKFRRELLNEWSGWPQAFCAHCNQPGTNPDLIKPLPSLAAIALGNIIYAARLQHSDFRSHSEILVIYRRKHIPKRVDEHVIKAKQRDVTINEIIFDEVQIERNLISYPSVARVVRAIDEGVIIQFPAYASCDFLEIKTTQDELELYLSLEDGAGSVFSEQLTLKPQGMHLITLQRKTVSSYYGILLRLKSIDSIKSIRLGQKQRLNVLENPDNTSSSYYVTQFQHIATYIHITAPCYFDNSAMVNIEFNSFNWMALFEQIELLLQTEREQLQIRNQALILEQNQLQLQNQSLVLERDQLQLQNQSLVLERDQLQLQNQSLVLERDQLQLQNQSLVLERDQLQLQNQLLVLERDQLQLQNQSLVLAQDQLQSQIQLLISEREQSMLKQNNLHDQNYKLLSELYALNNRFEVRFINKINTFLKKIMRFLIK